MKRLLFFVIYNKKNKLESRTTYTLKKMRNLYDKVIIISNSPLSKKSVEQLKNLSDEIIYRENKGYDFGAWRDGIVHLGRKALDKYDSVAIMNDTCYFPIFNFENIFNKMDNDHDLDFWGGSIHKVTKTGMPGTGGLVPEHIQSYFISFKHNLVKSDVFNNFWKSVKDYDEVNLVIQKYETQMTGIFSRAGYKYNAIFNPKNLNKYGNNIVDPVYEVPEKLLAEKFPFLKTKVVTAGRLDVFKNILKENSSMYPVKYIKVHEIHSLRKRIKHKFKFL